MSYLDDLGISYSSARYKSRIAYLKDQKIDPTIIEKGVNELIKNIGDGAQRLVVYGEPQSGKTEFMIALVCKFLDEGKKTIFVIMNDNTELESQNYRRFKLATQIDPSPLMLDQFLDLEERDKRDDRQRVIFCRKNSANLQKAITDGRFLEDRLILDDEADFASPDSKINKNEKASTINSLVTELGQLGKDGSGQYIGVTATPGRLDLNGTFANDADKWIFLESHSKYKGRSFFFPHNGSLVEKSDYILHQLPESGDSPEHLRDAMLRFLVRVAILNLIKQSSEQINYSMLIHTDGKVSSHEKDQKDVQKYLSILQNPNQHDVRCNQFAEVMASIAQKEIDSRKLQLSKDDAVRFVFQNIGRASVFVINHKKQKENVERACAPEDLFTFAIGGNTVSRGLTFNNLLTFFFSRSVKNKFSQNTYIQRARMFGTRPYASYFELCIPRDLYHNWHELFMDHELSIESARQGNYVHISSDRNSSADSASIKKNSTVRFGNEWVTGEIFKLNAEIEQRFDTKAMRPLDLIASLIKEGVLPDDSFQTPAIDVIKGLCDSDQSDVKICLQENGEFVEPKGKTFDTETLMRPRGGLVSQIIHDRPQFSGKHIILPVKNSKGEARLYFKTVSGKKILQHLS